MNISIKRRAITLAACTLMIVMQIRGSESNFSRQWGAMGTLHQAPTYFKTYKPACCKKARHQQKYCNEVEPTQQKAPKK